MYRRSVTDLSSNPTSLSQLFTSLWVHDLMEDWGGAPTTFSTAAAIDKHQESRVGLGWCRNISSGAGRKREGEILFNEQHKSAKHVLLHGRYHDQGKTCSSPFEGNAEKKTSHDN